MSLCSLDGMSPQSVIHNSSTRCSQFGKLIQKKYQVVSQKKKKKKSVSA